MFLFINTSIEKQIDVFLVTEAKVVSSLSLDGDYKVSEKLLILINKLMNENKTELNDLGGVMVVTGPGPFTSLRIAVTIANTLSYSLKIPVIGIENNKNLNNKDLIVKGIDKLESVKVGELIIPYYDQEPNIG